MSDSSHDLDAAAYTAVVNEEEQYSIWLVWRPLPAGWRRVGPTGSKAACLDYVASVWTDMRPLSVRRAGAGDVPRDVADAGAPAEEIDPLPLRLSRGSHQLELSGGTERSRDGLLRQIATGCVHVMFTGTRGGTELSIPLDADRMRALAAAVGDGAATIQLSGEMLLDDTRARCVVALDLGSWAGRGHLELLGEQP